MRGESKKPKRKRAAPTTGQYSRGVPVRETLKKQREYDRMKAREIPGKEKGAGRPPQAPRTVKQNTDN